MAKLDINRFGEMQMFVSVVDHNGFSAAAKAYQRTPSSVSKQITRLEQRLQTHLIHRSTRGFQLTPEGQVFYEHCLQVLSSLEEAEQSVNLTKNPTGNLRISTNIPIGQHYILPLVAKFQTQYPDITLEITLTDQVINLIDERTDIAIRSGSLKDSTLKARKIGTTELTLVASPSYLKKHGTPKTPDDLKNHRLLDFNFSRAKPSWPFKVNGKPVSIKPQPSVKISDGESLRVLALNHAGITRLARCHVQADLNRKRLVPVLEQYSQKDSESIYAVYLGQGNHLPIRIRTFIDFLVEHILIK